MKKIISTIVASMCLFAPNIVAGENGLYAGLDLLTSSNTFTVKRSSGGSEDGDLDSSGFKLKFGTVSNDGFRVQGYFLHEVYNETVFDSKNDALNEIGLEIIKGFEVTPDFLPFIQLGIGSGWMSIENASEDSISALSIKIGAGVMYKITPSFEVLAGVDFQARFWQDIITSIDTMETTEKSSKLYLGANVHF